MAPPAARYQYLKTQIETASKEQLVVMLFDGIIRFTEQARSAIEEKRLEDSHHALMRAQAIVMELICTLDKEKGGDVANNLMALHAYAFNCLIVCNMRKDVSKIDEVQNIYRKIREGWVGAMESLGLTSGTTGTGPGEPAPNGTKADASAPSTKALDPLPKPPSGSGGGIVASAKPPATSVAGLAAAPAASAPAPSAGGYGMGLTALRTAAPAKSGASAAPASPAPHGTPSVPPSPPRAATAPKPGMNAKQAAMLSAYQAGARSIA